MEKVSDGVNTATLKVKVAKSKLSGNAPKEVDERIAFCEEVLQLLQDLLPEMIEDMKAKDIEGYVEKTKKVHTLARLISATSEEIRNYCETGEFSGKTTIH